MLEGGEIQRCYFRLVHIPKSEILYEVPTNTIKLVVGLRWFDSAGECVGGVPLKQPEDEPDLVYSVIRGQFVEEEVFNQQTPLSIQNSKPFALFMHRHLR